MKGKQNNNSKKKKGKKPDSTTKILVMFEKTKQEKRKIKLNKKVQGALMY